MTRFDAPVDVEYITVVNDRNESLVCLVSDSVVFDLTKPGAGSTIDVSGHVPGFYFHSCKLKAVDHFVVGVGYVKRLVSSHCTSRSATIADIVKLGGRL